MTLKEAVRVLDENIPPPGNKMVDSEHLSIAVAWRGIKNALRRNCEELPTEPSGQ